MHPVLELLGARARGARDDGATLALVIEGGGMRGVVSSAMTAAIEARGLTGRFDLVVGASAGAVNGGELCAGRLASSRLPWIGGDPAQFRGRAYLDGGLAESIPYRTAFGAGATHALALMTWPVGVARTPPGGLADRIIERRLRRLNPA